MQTSRRFESTKNISMKARSPIWRCIEMYAEEELIVPRFGGLELECNRVANEQVGEGGCQGLGREVRNR